MSMIFSITRFAWNDGVNPYHGSQSNLFSNAGISDTISGSFRTGVADELTLELKGNALTPVPFAFRDRIIIEGIDQAAQIARTFFGGHVIDDPTYTGSPTENKGTVKLAGPMWYLENLVYQQGVDILQSFDGSGNPVFKTLYCTHFTLNFPLVVNYNPGPPPSITYPGVLQSSKQMLIRILEYALGNGAFFQYDASTLMDIPVLPKDVINITCADAIRYQMQDVDAVCWFDHAVVPPQFYCKQRKDLPTITKKIGVDATDFSLKQGGDFVSQVVIYFEQPFNVNNQSGITISTVFYPNPLPADSFKALITTVPVRAVNGETKLKWIKTEAIDIANLAWWQRRKPELDHTVNPNGATDYKNLDLLQNATRAGSLPNMIIEGGYADWMNGNVELDDCFCQIIYSRAPGAAPNLPTSNASAHTIHINITATDLDFPNGVLFSDTQYTSLGEDITAFNTMAEIIYKDLNAPFWEGTGGLFESEYSGTITLGNNLNLTNGQTDWKTMATLIQQLDFTLKPGGVRYQAHLGRNKYLTAAQLRDRMNAARSRYVTVFSFSPSPTALQTPMTRHEARNGISDAMPQLSQQHVFQANGGVLISANGNQSNLTLQMYDPVTGNPIQPNSSGTQCGSIQLPLSATKGSDGAWHNVTLREFKVQQFINGQCYQRTVIGLFSDIFQGSGDPASS